MDINELTYMINGAIFEVSKELGPGFLEKVYENALIIELNNVGLKAKSQIPLGVNYKGQSVGEYFADIVVNDIVLIELKTVGNLKRIHDAQILHYLKATGMRVGILVNFNAPKAQIRRFVNNL